MAWSDDFVTELATTTGLDALEVLAIAERNDASFAAALRKRERVAAIEKGRQLLLSHLDDGQRATFESSGYFDVVGSEGGRYRINGGGTVQPVGPDGYVGHGICFHSRDPLPLTDQALAQALFIEHDEAGMLRMVGRR